MVRPKKHLGQHFLTDQNIARKIVEALPEKTSALLEIGPGKGVLTKIILENKPDVFYAIDIDGESVDYLLENYPELHGYILHEDFLKFNARNLFQDSFTVLGNFPYNISSQIVFRILDNRDRVACVVGMFQKEVAERIASPPGSKKYGILSVLVQAFYKVDYLFTVGEGAFFPPPRVKSSVIRFHRNALSELGCDESRFFDVVKTAFNQRRKTLRNALKKFNLEGDSLLENLLKKRAEQLSVEEFVHLTKSISDA